MTLLHYIVPFAIALGVLILVHEMGHYVVARLCGVKVLRFSIGFGKPFYIRKAGKDGTEWALSAIPLGGYVKMLDEREGDVAADEVHRAFNRQNVWRRCAIVAAGPLTNIVLAVFIYWTVFIFGSYELNPRLATPAPASAAEAAGIREGDLVLSVGSRLVWSWEDFSMALVGQALSKGTATLHIASAEKGEVTRQIDLSAMDLEDPNPLERLGLAPWIPQEPPIVATVLDQSPAAEAGIEAGDRIVRIDGVPIHSTGQTVGLFRASPGKTLKLEIEREEQSISTTIVPDKVMEKGDSIGRIGVAFVPSSMFSLVKFTPGKALHAAFSKTWDTTVMFFRVIGQLVNGKLWKTIGGPITIADVAGKTAQLGMDKYLKFVAVISISLGILNLLPIPVLDGGHLLYYVIEIIKGSPVSERAMEIGQMIGLFLLLMLMAFAFYNDINRLISG